MVFIGFSSEILDLLWFPLDFQCKWWISYGFHQIFNRNIRFPLVFIGKSKEILDFLWFGSPTEMAWEPDRNGMGMSIYPSGVGSGPTKSEQDVVGMSTYLSGQYVKKQDYVHFLYDLLF